MVGDSRTVTLARVSSKIQEEGYSLDSQQKLLKKYCSEKRLKIINEFRISETASKNEQRKVFQSMLGYIKQNNITNLVVEKTDRLTRNFRDAVVVDDWLDGDQRRMLHMVKEGLVIHQRSRSDTKLMWNIYVSFAKKHTDNLREEAMKGWDEKLAQGWMPAPPPPGYKAVVENGRKIHVIDEDRAFLIERAYNLYLDPSHNINSVTEEVSKSGLVSRKGRPLGKTAVHKILHNPFYTGVIRFGGKEYPGAHEPLLSKELFDAVQDKLTNGYHERRVKHYPLFKGLLRCEQCGAIITWQLQKGRYYGACQRNSATCKGKRLMREDRLEDQLLCEIDKLDKARSGKAHLRRLQTMFDSRRNPYIGQHRISVMKMIRQQMRRLEKMEDNLYDDKLAGQLDDQKYTLKITTIHDELINLQQRFNRLEEIEGAGNVACEKPMTLRDMYLGESKNGKRLIIKELFKMRMVLGCVEFEPVEN